MTLTYKNKIEWCGQYHEISHGDVTIVFNSNWLDFSKYNIKNIYID